MYRFIPVCEPLLSGNELRYVTEAVSTGWISSSGKYVTKFEQAFADYCGVKYAVAVCNGTVALHLLLTAAGLGKGDEVIVPSFTMIASAFAVCYTGALPVLVDADKDTWNIDTAKIEEKITPKTKAIMPVHIFGNPCRMAEIQRIAREHNLLVLDDAAEAHGAEYAGVKAGKLADLTAFSFFANKNLTTGEGGMVVTDSPEYYDKLRYYRNVCFPLDAPRVYQHEDIGFNYRMSNLHAALGLAQVEKADYYRGLRIKNAALYQKYLTDIEGIRLQRDEPQGLNVHWMNAVLIEPRVFGRTKEQVIEYLQQNGIETRLLFTGMHQQNSLKKYGCDCTGEYPVCDKLTENGFYLPSGSNLTEDEIEFVCAKIREARG
ncbi:putative pyridoxal phosphate-dependent aminotransferase EpsN [Candidatus Termititenax persephonae]|uniref:Pyridoxal phosphate-dependent aminotransferase EpsN n=1 Tax=Candidatus Termititenax persephonae TaxID=2218525 RepID=A0A388TEM4_9BACT|nr:putative pyridoxal phosphate-dependent aminotransferase EpsN [Candidatus Termititenax persephonae]